LKVKDVLHQLPFLATSPTFFNSSCCFGSLLRLDYPHDELLNVLSFQDYFLCEGEILIAIPQDLMPRENLGRARGLVNANMNKLLAPDILAVQRLQSSADWAREKCLIAVDLDAPILPDLLGDSNHRTLLWV
jgi:hypothetical protein